MLPLHVGVGEKVQLVAIQVVSPAEAIAHADGPGKRHRLQVERLLDVLQDVEGRQAVPVHLVDEGDDGGVLHPAHLHQLLRLLLHAISVVEHHDDAVGSREDAVRVLREVAVARGVEQVQLVAAIRKLHHRGGHADSALLLHRHPVAHGEAVGLAGLNLSGLVDGPALQQELFGQGRLARVRVADDGEGPPLFNLLTEFRIRLGVRRSGSHFWRHGLGGAHGEIRTCFIRQNKARDQSPSDDISCLYDAGGRRFCVAPPRYGNRIKCSCPGHTAHGVLCPQKDPHRRSAPRAELDSVPRAELDSVLTRSRSDCTKRAQSVGRMSSNARVERQ